MGGSGLADSWSISVGKNRSHSETDSRIESLPRSSKTATFALYAKVLSENMGGKDDGIFLEKLRGNSHRQAAQITKATMLLCSIEEDTNTVSRSVECQTLKSNLPPERFEMRTHRNLLGEEPSEGLRQAVEIFESVLSKIGHAKIRRVILPIQRPSIQGPYPIPTRERRSAPHQFWPQREKDIEEAIQYLQGKVGQAAAPEILLPAEEKRVIENQPYGKQPRAAEMSEKLRDAIEKGEHPGAFIYRELIRPSKQTLQTLAREIGVHYNSLTYLKTEQTSLSPEMASKLSRYFQKYSTVELLMVQAGHDAKKADQEFLIGLPEHKDPTPA